jgi:hypothetical protein
MDGWMDGWILMMTKERDSERKASCDGFVRLIYYYYYYYYLLFSIYFLVEI